MAKNRLVSLILFICLVLPGSAMAGSTQSLVLINTGGDWGKCQRVTFADTFEKKTGIKIIDGPFLDDGQIKAAVETSVYDVDVVFPTPSLALEASGKKYLEPIDFSRVNKEELLPGTYTKYAVALDLFAWAFGFRTDAKAVPTQWADFFDAKKFPGKRGLVSWDFATVMIGALIADGVSPDKLVPLDIDRALAKLDTIKKDIVWFGTGSDGQNLLNTGEVSYIQLYANRITTSRDKGEPVDIIWDGQIIQADYLGIPKGSPNVTAAQQLIAHMTSKEINGKFSFCQPGAPSNTKSEVNPAMAKDLPTSHLDKLHVISSSPEIAGYIEQHLEEITNRFNNWKAEK
ncbi:extracellular solute-binding protein [Desulfospira joergensenii]|uniref:extracellular solute-binding protein n=1 Tax=Desulfospira joergensenii TaxID=53329 RepID=UPI0003FC92E8|nr:extracellular solute-binding protein [Desulfospira joergensenii]